MPDLTNEQIRDRLAKIAGWRCLRKPVEETPTSRGETGRWRQHDDGKGRSTEQCFHPIPPLDSPEALGVVAGMLPEGWTWDRIDFHPECNDVLVWVWMGKSIRSRERRGPTETIARALAVIAAHEAEGGKPC